MFLGINVFYIKKTIGTNEGVINNVIIFEPMHYSLSYFFNCFWMDSLTFYGWIADCVGEIHIIDLIKYNQSHQQ
jgi:hypothetical protein